MKRVDCTGQCAECTDNASKFENWIVFQSETPLSVRHKKLANDALRKVTPGDFEDTGVVWVNGRIAGLLGWSDHLDTLKGGEIHTQPPPEWAKRLLCVWSSQTEQEKEIFVQSEDRNGDHRRMIAERDDACFHYSTRNIK